MALINWQWQNPDVINDQRNAVAANKEAMEYNQTAALNKIFSQNIDTHGNLDNASFYDQASKAGLSPDRIRAAADLYNQQQETNKNTATTDMLNRMFGYNPTAGGRNNAQIGDSTPIITGVDSSGRQIVENALRQGAQVVGPIPLPTEIKRFTVNRSTFVHKDAREQFEMRVHKRMIDILNPNRRIIDTLQNLNLPSGVDVEIKM